LDDFDTGLSDLSSVACFQLCDVRAGVDQTADQCADLRFSANTVGRACCFNGIDVDDFYPYWTACDGLVWRLTAA
jgi:hypothetical protein